MNRGKPQLIHSVSCALLSLALLVLAGCSLPRIIVLNDPLSVDEHINLGKIYESQQKDDLAEQQYLDALHKDQNNLSALLLLGDLSFRIKKYSEAETAYRKAVRLQPENGDIYNNLCWVFLNRNDHIEEAQELISRALSLTPEHRAFYLDTQGVIFLRLGKISEAIITLEEAVALLPTDNATYLVETYVHLSDAYRSSGDMNKAREAEQSADKYRVQQ
jgi:Tfp pilus assembly protein PilF